MGGLSVSGLKALGWTFIAVDILLSIGRFYIRWRSTGPAEQRRSITRFGVDDALHLLALLGAIVYVALQSSGLAIFLRVEFYNIEHKGHADLADENRFFHIRFGAVLIFWVTIYAVKFSFLMFYRSLFWISHTFRKYWYGVATFTFVGFAAIFISCFWVCGYPVNPLSLTQCMKKHSKVQNNIEYTWVAINTVSTLMILALPLSMLRKLKIRISQKFSLGFMFALASADIVFDWLRTFYTTQSTGLNNLWEILEIVIAVMLSALIAYRQLFTHLRNRKRATPQGTYASGRPLVSGSTAQQRYNTRNGGAGGSGGLVSTQRSGHHVPIVGGLALSEGERDLWRTEPKLVGGDDDVTQTGSMDSIRLKNVV